MLYLINFHLKNNILKRSLFIGLLSIALHASRHASGEDGCRTSSGMIPQTSLLKELARNDEYYQNLSSQHNMIKMLEFNDNASCKADLEDLQKESLQKVDELKNNKEFSSIVAELESKRGSVKDSLDSPELNSGIQGQHSDANLPQANLPPANLYIFISFSMGEKALLNLAHEAKQYGAVLVLRGFKDGSYLKTAKALQEIILKTGQGVLIDPELYTLFDITAVPTFILAKPFKLSPQERIQTPIKWAPIKWAPIHDKIQGHVSICYALEQFAREGELNKEAQSLLERGAVQ